jgi:hypothetical protein
MIKIGYKSEITAISNLPLEVINAVSETATILDDNYGEQRDINLVSDEIGIEVTSAIPEYVDLIRCSNGKDYTNSLILCNNDFGISLMIPIELTPKELLNWME